MRCQASFSANSLQGDQGGTFLDSHCLKKWVLGPSLQARYTLFMAVPAYLVEEE